MKYKTMENKIKVLEHSFAASAGAYYNINLTTDTVPGTMYQVIDDKEYSINEQIGMPENARFSDVVKYWSAQVPQEEKAAYFDALDVSRLLEKYANGENHVSVLYHTKSAIFEPMLAEQHIVMYPDEETGEILAVSYVLDKTAESCEENNRHELEEKNEELRKMLDVEKQYSGLISAMSKVYCQIFSVNLSENRYYEVYAFSEKYRAHLTGLARETFADSVRRFVADEHKDAMAEFLNPDTLQKRLSAEDYITQDYMASNGTWYNAGYIAQKRDESGRVETVLFTVQDVNARVREKMQRQHRVEQLNRQLKEGNERLATQIHVISGLSNAFIAVFRIELVSNLCMEVKNIAAFSDALNGIRKTDAVTSAFVTLCVSPEHKEIMTAFTDAKSLAERMKNTDTLVQEFHGTIFPWEWCRASWVAADRDENGSVTEALFTVEDVTADVSQRNELEAERDKELAAAEAANRAKSTFLFNMSHDIRTPMNAILGYSELASRNPDLPEIVREYMKKIQISGEGMLSILNNVLELSRIESGKAVLEESAQVAGSVLEACMVMLNPEIEKKRHKLTFTKQVISPYIYFDATNITEITLNILSNAIKYTADGGTIQCSLKQYPSEKEGWINQEFTVADSGIGMSREFMEHIFESFSRERTSTESGIQGTGLGMGIVKKLVDLLGGTITIDSEIGKGTTVTIAIPCRVATFEETQPKRAEELVDRDALKGKRILLAEDNELNAEIAVTLLEEDGLQVERVSNGVECVEAVEKNPAGYYDIVLMDVQMPVMDGYLATDKIRKLADAEKARIPIIAMTANAFTEDKAKALRVGMNDHVAKPIDMNKLIPTLLQYV